jgi:hypothetical protein
MPNPLKRMHVTPDGKGNWNVTPAGRRPVGNFDTQREAQDAGRRILRDGKGGELTTHRPDGRIRDSDTIAPANDPYPPKG